VSPRDPPRDTPRAAAIDAIRNLEDILQVPTYAKAPVAIVRGLGCRLWDSEGRPWLDFYGGHSVALTGHCHPKVVDAICKQAERLIFYSNAVYSDVRGVALEALLRAAPRGMTQAFLCNSGTEANEAALKTARRVTRRPGVVAMAEGFHGRTLGALSVTGLGNYRDYGGPVVEGTTFVPFGDLAAAARAVDRKTAAVILEPIPYMGGVRVAPSDYYSGLRELCDRAGAMLVFDEVQTGLGRTGKMWCGEHFGVVPDLITLAKGLASGIPCGAVLFRDEVARTVKLGDHGSTFGGGPIACAALKATLSIIRDEDLVARAAVTGAALAEGARGLRGVREVRGLGLLLAIACDGGSGKVVQERLRERRVIVSTVSGDPSAIRVLPPLVVGPEEVEEFLRALDASRPDLP